MAHTPPGEQLGTSYLQRLGSEEIVNRVIPEILNELATARLPLLLVESLRAPRPIYLGSQDQ